MRKLIVLLFLSQGLLAQTRENKPLPIFPKKPVKILDEGITGWSLSMDGQWISQEMKIPVRLISTNEDQYETKINSLGNDNIEELQIYPAIYGNDTLIMLVKIYETGAYEYQRTKKGWDDYLLAYYFVIDHKELRKLKAISSEASVIELEMKDFGLVTDVRTRNVLDDIRQKMIVKPETQRRLAFIIRKMDSTGKIQFQFASLHEVFRDVEGVLNDFQLRGRSLYGKEALLDHLYYEMDEDTFKEFFLVPPSMNWFKNK